MHFQQLMGEDSLGRLCSFFPPYHILGRGCCDLEEQSPQGLNPKLRALKWTDK